ncbi:PhoU family transcriptional regulator, partial [Saccharothrix sp. ST-888]
QPGTETAFDVTPVGRYYERFADHAGSGARRAVLRGTGDHAREFVAASEAAPAA